MQCQNIIYQKQINIGVDKSVAKNHTLWLTSLPQTMVMMFTNNCGQDGSVQDLPLWYTFNHS